MGKTTLIRRLISELETWCPAGFYTEEILEAGVRRGFEWVDLGGRRGVLSRVSLKSPFRVGKYGVDVEGFEAYLSSLKLKTSETRVVILDEIGKMECLSPKFRFLLLEVLDSDKLLIATIALKGTSFIETIKRRDDVELFHLSPDNRDSLGRTILRSVWGNPMYS